MDAAVARRARRRAEQAGLTAIEAAVGFAVIGSVLVVAVPAFVREVHGSKQAEAALTLSELGSDTIAYATGKPTALAFPPSAPLTPSEVPRGVRRADPAGAWDHPTWVALGFRPFADDVPHAYAFELDTSLGPTRSTFRAAAHGDLDGDGTTSTFEIRGSADDQNGAKLEPGMLVVGELE